MLLNILHLRNFVYLMLFACFDLLLQVKIIWGLLQSWFLLRWSQTLSLSSVFCLSYPPFPYSTFGFSPPLHSSTSIIFNPVPSLQVSFWPSGCVISLFLAVCWFLLWQYFLFSWSVVERILNSLAVGQVTQEAFLSDSIRLWHSVADWVACSSCADVISITKNTRNKISVL